jgi:hypothetical protein
MLIGLWIPATPCPRFARGRARRAMKKSSIFSAQAILRDSVGLSLSDRT